MTDLSGIVKAYDVRGVVGEQLDDAVVREIGAALARLLRAEDPATQAVVVGHDMRDVARPTLAAAFAEGVTGAGRRRGRHRPGQHRHALLRLRRPRPARRDVHRQPQPGPLQRHQAVPGGRRAGRPGHRPARRSAAARRAGRARRRRRRRGTGRPSATCSPTTPPTCAAWSTCPASGRCKVVVDAGNGMGGHTVPAVLGGLPLDARAAVLRARRHLPQPRGQPARPGEPRRPAGARSVETGADLGLAFDGDADRCFVVDERGEPVSPARDHRAGRRPRAGQGTRAAPSSTT